MVLQKPCGICGSLERTNTGDNCKPCHARLDREYYAKNRDRVLSRQHRYYAKNRTRVLARSARYRSDHIEERQTYDRERYANNPERKAYQDKALMRYKTVAARAAHNAVRRAIRAGRMSRPEVCEECGRGGPIDAAHFDYAERLKVRWLCRSCHVLWDLAEPKARRDMDHYFPLSGGVREEEEG